MNELWCNDEEQILKQFEISKTFDIQSFHFGKYKNKESYKSFNLLALISKKYMFSCKYKSIPIPNIHALKMS